MFFTVSHFLLVYYFLARLELTQAEAFVCTLMSATNTLAFSGTEVTRTVKSFTLQLIRVIGIHETYEVKLKMFLNIEGSISSNRLNHLS